MICFLCFCVVLYVGFVFVVVLLVGVYVYDVGDSVYVIMQQVVFEVLVKCVVVVIVDYVFGQVFDVYKYFGLVFVVVLKGEVLLQVNGGLLCCYCVGEGWYELFGLCYQVLCNVSVIEFVQFVVFGLMGEYQLLKLLIDQ